MQEGSFRCDANVSVRPKGEKKLGTRTEIKNVNSFRFVERALEYEIARQIEILQSGGQVVQETRLYDAELNETRSMRSKEEAMDYRYFPDPDLPPLAVDEAFIEEVRATLPELPDAKRSRFMSQYGLSAYDATVLTGSREMADYYEKVVEKSKADPKMVANWIAVELSGYLNKENKEISDSPVSASMLAGLLKNITDNTISGKIGKQVLEQLWYGGSTFAGDDDKEMAASSSLIVKMGLQQITDTGAIEKAIDEVIAKNPEQLEQYRAGKETLFGYFVGQVMKATGGKANPQQVNELLKKKLGGGLSK
jgi:aspartyl-tRNA(Asn)/glutamyl-tRNA(Gln) amidotransferase subunit B